MNKRFLATAARLLGACLLSGLTLASCSGGAQQGRHSSYLAKTTVRNGWQRLKFLMHDRIDGETADDQVDQVVLMPNPDSYTADTYYIDNYAIYSK